MKYKLMIVENPAKVRQISSLLGKGWKVEASLGQLRDLPKDEFGIDLIDGSFQAHYRIMDGKLNVVKRLKKAIAQASAVYLAFDPDQEGETAAWHVLVLCKEDLEGKKVYRLAFNALTQEAITAAIASPLSLNYHLVDAQRTRRVMDRLVRYTVSPLASKMLGIHGVSIGRLQGLCLWLIVEREREIRSALPVRYWTLKGVFQADADEPQVFPARLWVAIRRGMDKPTPTDKLTREQVQQLMWGLTSVKYWIRNIVEEKVQIAPPQPFAITSLLQTANQQLGLSAERATELAHKLYEYGLITYPGTSGTTMTAASQEAARAYIATTYGPMYVSPSALGDGNNAPVDFEVTRPVDVTRLPDTLGDAIDADGAALYDLIWKRWVASQMAAARYINRVIYIAGGKVLRQQSYPLEFHAQSRVCDFDGFEKVLKPARDDDSEEIGDIALPLFVDGHQLHFVEWSPVDHPSQIPSRYTEASLIEFLEQHGIGLPTSYASLVRDLSDRGYIAREKGQLVPTETGFTFCDFLFDKFEPLFAVDFVAEMERSLGQVAVNTLPQQEALQRFWDVLQPLLKDVATTLERRAKERLAAIPIGEACPKCGHELVQRLGTHGPFIGCSNYPRCQYSRGGSRPLHVVDKLAGAPRGSKAS